MYDVIIVGSGPAGLTAAIYASRRELNTLILRKEFGGQVVSTSHIENYPGFKKITGMELMKSMEEQVKDFKVEIISHGVNEIKEKNGFFSLKTDDGKIYESKTVILAFGKSPRKLGALNEDKFENKGVSYCVNCDGPLFKDETIAVVGGGNSALDAALLMSEIGKKVYLIHRRNEFRGFESFVTKLKGKKNVEFILETEVKEFNGDKMLESITIENVKTHEKTKLKVAGVFIEVGSEVHTDFVKDLVKLDEFKHIVINEKCETFVPGTNKIKDGVFAAGDVTNSLFKQIVIAAGQGATAALQAYNYIKGVSGQVTDWGSKK